MIDHDKIQKRNQMKLVRKLENKFNKKISENEINSLFFDGKRGDTKIFIKIRGFCKLHLTKLEKTLHILQSDR